MDHGIQLTDQLHVSNGAHILYLFEDRKLYVRNLATFIKQGVKRSQHLLIIEDAELFSEVKAMLKGELDFVWVHHMDNKVFYRSYGTFNYPEIVRHFEETIAPLILEGGVIRTWAHVVWNKTQEEVEPILHDFEKIADGSVKEMGLTSVCAYDASELSARLQTNMMHSHEYLMTDTELVRSSLYRQKDE